MCLTGDGEEKTKHNDQRRSFIRKAGSSIVRFAYYYSGTDKYQLNWRSTGPTLWQLS